MLKKIDYKFHFKPLMERKNEIMLLFKYYFDTFSQKKFEKLINIDPAIEILLTKHNWPGNVFEVMNLAQNLINNMVSTRFYDFLFAETISGVFGFLPILAFFNLIVNVPNLESFNFFSSFKFNIIKEKNSSIKFSDICFEKPSCI